MDKTYAMNNSNDDLFPDRSIPIDFDGFTYVQSSKPIVDGDLVIFNAEGSGFEDYEFLIGICADKYHGSMSLLTGEILIPNVPLNKCRRLTFSIPTDLTRKDFSN